MIWLLDPGHGHVIFGEYFTPGKRSPQKPPGIFEGEFNHEVCDLICASYETNVRNHPDKSEDTHRILNIAPGPINIPLVRKKKQGGQCRIEFINDLYRRFKPEPIALISVHANAAARPGWSNARGFVVFTSRNSSSSSKRLSSIVSSHMSNIPDLSRRFGGQEQANYTIIKKTKCPAILVECGFMTNKFEATFLASHAGKSLIASAILEGMHDYELALAA